MVLLDAITSTPGINKTFVWLEPLPLESSDWLVARCVSHPFCCVLRARTEVAMLVSVKHGRSCFTFKNSNKI